MAKNRIFLPQDVLDRWQVDDRVTLHDGQLSLGERGRRYRLIAAVRVVREVSGTDDANELVGLCKSRVFIDALEAEILESSMILGDNAYDVVPGWFATPVGSFAEHVAGGGEALGATCDEQLLAAFAAGAG